MFTPCGFFFQELKKIMKNANYNNTQAQILDAAMRYFAQHGYRGAAIAKIAKEAGVSKSLIFWYFDNKAKLFEALMDRFITHCIMSLDVESPPGNPQTKIENLIDTYWYFIQGNFKFVRIFMNWFLQLDPSKKAKTQKLRELHTKFRNILEGYLTEGIQTGIFRKDLNISATSLYLISSLEGVLLQMFISELSFDALGAKFFMDTKQNILLGILAQDIQIK